MFAYFNNRFAENEEARLHVSDLSMQRGYAVFDYFRVIDGMPLFISDHLDRLFSSASAMHLQVKQTKDEIREIIFVLSQKTGLPMAGIRILITGGYSPDSYQPAEPNLVITCHPLKLPSSADFEKGLSIITYEHQRELPHIKSINYQVAVWLQPLLQQQQADDVLYYKNNIVTEFPRSNLFMVTADNKLVTPKNNILPGVTRKNVLSIASDMMPEEERDITVFELTHARELFLTSTSKRILPVVQVNGQFVADGKPGKITENIYQQFIKLEQLSAGS